MRKDRSRIWQAKLDHSDHKRNQLWHAVQRTHCCPIPTLCCMAQRFGQKVTWLPDTLSTTGKACSLLALLQTQLESVAEQQLNSTSICGLGKPQTQAVHTRPCLQAADSGCAHWTMPAAWHNVVCHRPAGHFNIMTSASCMPALRQRPHVSSYSGTAGAGSPSSKKERKIVASQQP